MTYATFKKIFKEAEDATDNQMLTEALMKAVWKKLNPSMRRLTILEQWFKSYKEE